MIYMPRFSNSLFQSLLLLCIFFVFTGSVYADDDYSDTTILKDEHGDLLNAHGGNVVYINGAYFLVGEYRTPDSIFTQKFSLYKSKDLKSWENLGVVYDLSHKSLPYNVERPKLIYNSKIKKYIIWYHEEFGKNFSNAKVAVAISDKISGPYVFFKSYRPNPKAKPIYDDSFKYSDEKRVIADAQFRKDFSGGQMSRDMNIFQDDDGKAYIVSSSENNKTIQISELSDDYLSFTGVFSRVLVGRISEAPVIFKRKGIYYLLTSGVTGYHPTLLHLAISHNIMKGWKDSGYPIKTNDKKQFLTSFGTQVSSVLKVHDSDDYVFISDRWDTWKLFNSKYVWLSIHWNNSVPYIEWNLYK